ncbi:glutathione gamma-glutamylcysteinyltransferase 1-like [Olea europaea var. sylvestris]|uniref:glutathione gamma-glutamylcysteinyltransferase 1-like n=1 Tax=Olea europaea var. sylvestris TaxID=158386 RepID=UPI000C1CF009|nr:glutathione gamma-glutamylcysteinyltransferase 1-like [Olea europaea var. sylvestris]
MDDLPVLLSSNDVKDVKHVISTIFKSLPLDFAEFIKWVAKVRRQEEGGQGVSQEEKERVAIKEEVLKQVEETGLYKHVTNILSSEKSSCQIKQTIGLRDSLPNIAASVCCQGAGILIGKLGLADRFCCREIGVRCYMANGDKPVTAVSGIVVNSNGEQGVDIVVPLSQKEPNCCSVGSCGYSIVHPASNNILTALLLALPP